MHNTLTAVIVTRGDVNMVPVVEPLAESPMFEEEGHAQIWDNKHSSFDAKVFGRFIAASIASRRPGNLIYTQDDDCRVPNCHKLLEAWKPGLIVCNMGEDFQRAYAGRRARLLGFGSVFEASLIRPTFDRYFKHFPMDDLFLRECDRIFTGLNTERCIMVDVGHEDMSYASDPNRMWKQRDHGGRLVTAEDRVSVILARETVERFATEDAS